jgi:hypothetical protein
MDKKITLDDFIGKEESVQISLTASELGNLGGLLNQSIIMSSQIVPKKELYLPEKLLLKLDKAFHSAFECRDPKCHLKENQEKFKINYKDQIEKDPDPLIL